MSSEAPAGRGGRGRRKGGGTGGRGRGGNTGEGNNASGGPKPNSRPRRRGGKPIKPPPITEEEKQRLEEEKKAVEEAVRQGEERKRQEEERKSAEAAKQALIQRQIELCKQVSDACESLASTVEITQRHKESRAAFAAEPLSKARKEFEANKKKLKSDLKKCTAFVKKIKSGSAWSMRPDEIQRDVAALNLFRYVEEVASALTDAKLKVADLPVVVALCSAMHQRYADFLPAVLPSMWSTIHGKATEATAKLRRLYLRIITEFLLNGLITETKPLIKAIGEATGGTDGSYVVTDANLVTSFVRAAGFEILGTKPRSIQDGIELLKRESERALETASQRDATGDNKEAEAEISTAIDVKLAEKAQTMVVQVEGVIGERAISPAVTEVLATFCVGAYQFLATSLQATHAKLQKLEKRCEQDRLVAGSLPEAREKGLTDARKLLESLQKSVETLSDLLVEPPPELKEEQEEGDGDGTGVGLELWTKEGEGGDFGPFDDEETRAFYCDIPDLLTTIPPVLLGMTQDDIDRIQTENLVKYGAGYESVLDEGNSSEEMVASSEADFEATEAEGEDEQTKEVIETGECLLVACVLYVLLPTWLTLFLLFLKVRRIRIRLITD
jgi:regulator of nonsense transcripts 2